MPDPFALPPEILHCIFDHLSPDVSVAPPLLATGHKWDQLAHLAACNLVNREWHAYTLPKLYEAFRFHGYSHSFWRLWKFVRTAIESPDLAALVRYLDLGEYHVDSEEESTRAELINTTRREQRRRRRENRNMYTIAQSIGISYRELSNAFRQQYQCVYLFILVSILPNVLRLYLSTNNRYTNYHLVLYSALKKRCLLGRLEVAMCYMMDTPASAFEDFCEQTITERWFFLPSLQELLLYDLDLHIFDDDEDYDEDDFYYTPIDPKDYRTSSVKKLTICPGEIECVYDYRARGHLEAILQLPKNLVSLTLCMPRINVKGGPF